MPVVTLVMVKGQGALVMVVIREDAEVAGLWVVVVVVVVTAAVK